MRLGRRLKLLLGLLLFAAVVKAWSKPDAPNAVEATRALAAGAHAPAGPASRHPARGSGSTVRRTQSASPSSGDGGTMLDPNQAVFSSREACERQLELGVRAPRRAGTARIGSWNVRWFPDGKAGTPSGSQGITDVSWLGCAIAYLNVDALALQETKSNARARAALDNLVARLTELTGERHAYRIDDCPDGGGQHLAWLWNQTRTSLEGARMHAALNPHGDSCAKQLRPGFGVTLRFPKGLDLHAIAVHLKSGTTRRDLELREKSLQGLDRVVSSVVAQSKDHDVLVLGDFNTMGAKDSAERSNAAAEALFVDGRLAAFKQPLRRLPSDLGCSEYYQRRPSLLDHFLVTRTTREVLASAKTETFGLCRSFSCESYAGEAPSAYANLSDHCPLVLSLTDADLD